MAGYELSLGKDLLPGLLSGQDGLAKLVEAVLNQVLEAQVSEALGAERHERSEDRQGYRNGYRARTLAGDVAGTADAGRRVLDRDLQALPAQ